MTSSLAPVVRALSFGDDRLAELDGITEDRWRTLLALCDRARLTLPLGVRAINRLPPRARERVDRNLRDNAVRRQRTVAAYREIADAFAAASVEFLVLKGFTHDPFYAASLDHRPQYDLDIYCPAGSIERAQQAVAQLGYAPHGPSRSTLDHLPPMIRRTGWRPTGDYFDPEMPLTVELHHRLWDPATERFSPGSSEAFWTRRTVSQMESLSYPALHPTDRLSYATWHMVRHLLRGDLLAFHAYEVAHFLDSTASDDYWWGRWRDSRETYLVEAIGFRLAHDWFDCRMNPTAAAAVDDLPGDVQAWFEHFLWSPLDALERPNKDELFLHLSLTIELSDRACILKRRLLPVRYSAPTLDAHNPNPPQSLIWKRRLFALWVALTRTVRHVQVSLAVLRSALVWRRSLSLQPTRRVNRKPRSESVRA